MHDIGKVVFDEYHEQGQSHHDEETGEKDPGEVSIVPRGKPVMLYPLAQLEASTILYSHQSAWNLVYANNRDQYTCQQHHAGQDIEDSSTLMNGTSINRTQADLAQ